MYNLGLPLRASMCSANPQHRPNVQVHSVPHVCKSSRRDSLAATEHSGSRGCWLKVSHCVALILTEFGVCPCSICRRACPLRCSARWECPGQMQLQIQLGFRDGRYRVLCLCHTTTPHAPVSPSFETSISGRRLCAPCCSSPVSLSSQQPLTGRSTPDVGVIKLSCCWGVRSAALQSTVTHIFKDSGSHVEFEALVGLCFAWKGVSGPSSSSY